MNPVKHHHTSRIGILSFAILLGAGIPSFGQTTVVKDAPAIPGTTVVIPGEDYKRSGYHNFWWGKHYRKEWNTPVRVPDFYLDTAKGGLTPYARGGGRQSKTLRLRNFQGKEYVLRSVNKDLQRGMSEDVRGTLLGNMIKDQGSIAHPFTGITITPMAEAAGIYHTVPLIVFVPKQSTLGEYNDEYGDQLYLFEQRPDGDHSESANFAYTKNLIGTDRLWEHLYKDNDNHVDQRSFIRARLFDMIIGDWGRHPDNWRWARFDEGKTTIYRAVPRDRDQAYSKIDGFYPSLSGKFYKPLQGFKSKIKNVPDWNTTARHLDQSFLNELGREVWLSEATQLQQLLTDSLISYSVRQIPPEVFSISGDRIIATIKARRDRLHKYAEEYYDFLSTRVDVIGSQDREYFRVTRLPDNKTEINIYKITKEGETRTEPFYSRIFNASETKEIRLYGLESKDVIEVKGEPGKGSKIRIIDPGAEDSIVHDKSLYEKIALSSGKKYEYDTLHAKKFDLSLRPIISSSRYKVFDNDPLQLFPRTGIKIVTSITYTPQPWKKERYENVHHLCANWGFLRGAFNLGYVGRLGRLAGKWDLLVKARLDGPAVENYFGTGNNTKNEIKTTNYYRTYSTRLFGSIGVDRDFAKYHHAEFAFMYHSVKVDRKEAHFISENQQLVDPVIFNRNQYAGVQAGYTYLKANDVLLPTRGFGLTFGTGYLRNINNTEDAFLKAILKAFVYIPVGKRLSVAVRAGGGTMTSNANYYFLNTVGGAGTGEIRGYDRERFYGRHSFHLNNDLRWLFPTRNFLFVGRAGLLGFYDVGRVWQPREISTIWHTSYGFGLVVAPFEKFAVTATYGISKDGNYTHFKAGFFF